MIKDVLFIQGGGEDGYEVDKALVLSLKKALGKEYNVQYPEIKPDESAVDFGWLQQLGNILFQINSNIILVGHSFGASMILKYQSENSADTIIHGIFLIATPFWSGNEDWEKGLKLRENFTEKLPAHVPVFFYHCLNDEEVPVAQLNNYKQKLPGAIFREIKSGGHQLNNDLSLVAKDIQSLQNEVG